MSANSMSPQPVVSEKPNTLEPKSPRKRIDVTRAFGLYCVYRSIHKVADILGCTFQAVHKRLQPYSAFIDELKHLQERKPHRLELMQAAEATLMRSLVDDAAIEKAPLAARATTYGILNERRRLEEGKSTQNVLHGAIVRIQKEALDLTMKSISVNPEKGNGVEAVDTTHKPHTSMRTRRAK